VKVNRVEQHRINKNHPMFKIIDDLAFRSKNVYNYGNYIIRQEFINNNKWIRYEDLSKQIKHSDCFMALGSNSAQMTLRILDKTWKSFFTTIKDWTKNPSKYLGRPKLPKYKDKNKGRFAVVLTNVQTKINNGYLYFSFKELKQFNNMIRTNIIDKLLQTRFIPNGGEYILELVYEKEVEEIEENHKNIVGIDLGLNNFVTMVNNCSLESIIINGKGIKSINQYYNKQLAHYKSLSKTNNKLDWTKRLQQITNKRYNRMDIFLHKVSKYIVDWCVQHNINTIVIGKNDNWKQESKMSKKTNQSFIQIPHAKFIEKLQYKCEDKGLNFILTEESYTSKASFIDSDIMPKYGDKVDYKFSGKRIKRGLYQSKKGKLINADCNGAYNIIRKVFPNVFTNGIEGLHLHPILINVN
jgi:putative transposase